MKHAKDLFITILRDKKTSRTEFRRAAHLLAHLLAQETIAYLETESVAVQTPIGKAIGSTLKYPVILIPILRSGITLLPAFLNYFEDAAIGVVGLKRDEKTAQAHLYYSNLPPIKSGNYIIILDPMIATGGTGVATLQILKDQGIPEKNILFVAVVSAPEGVNAIRSRYPDVRLIIAAEDEALNAEKFIVPGLGDFGDRYFGTE